MTLAQVQAMSDEELRIKVAELNGWIYHDDGGAAACWEQPVTGYRFVNVPDYPNDLNAMHEAENVIPDNLFGDYGIWLERLGDNDGLTATARQRAEALVLTMTEAA